MATFEKGILGGFSGKVGNVVGSRWRGKDVMRSLPQRGKYTPTEKQKEQRDKFKTVVAFINPIKSVLGVYYGKPQGDCSRFNMATSYHLTEALDETPQGYEINYAKVLISKGDLRPLDNPNAVAAANQTIQLTWIDNSGQGNANPDDVLLVVVYAPTLNVFQTIYDAGTRDQTSAIITLANFLSGNEVQIWATFVTQKNTAAVSSFLGTVQVS